MIQLLAIHLPDGTADFGVVGLAIYLATRDAIGFRKRNHNPNIGHVLAAINELKTAIAVLAKLIDERLPKR